jgi:transcription antitermination factor NusG
MPNSKKKWYVVYTKPRWEKKVHGLMLAKGMEAYCPLNRVRKKWSDRVKWVEEPLFRSYVFIKIAEEEQSLVRMVNGVVNFVYWLSKPAIVKDREIEIIRQFLNDYDEVEATAIDLRVDDRVMILHGVLMNKEAKVLRVVNNKVQVIIESIGYSLMATIDKSNVTVNGK